MLPRGIPAGSAEALRTALRWTAGALLAVALTAGVAAARPLTDDETKALDRTVLAFDAAMKAADFEGIGRTVPPRVLEHIAGQAGIGVENLRKAMMQQMSAVMKDVTIASFSMDMAKARHRELTDGTPYVLVPTQTVIDAGAMGKTAVRSDTLALMDGGAWYLLRVSDAAQVAILRQVYPGFAAVEFSGGSSEAVEE